jgi:hypothetical protein
MATEIDAARLLIWRGGVDDHRGHPPRPR